MTDKLDPNQRGEAIRRINDASSPPRVGRVVAVRAHTGDESPPSNHEADVAVPPGSEADQQHRDLAIQQPVSGAAFVPRVGDLVLVEYRNGDSPFVAGAVYGDAEEDRAPIASAGDIRLTRGDLAVELAGDGSSARLSLRPDATTEPDLVVEVGASGTIRLGKPDGTLMPVARKGDAVSGTTSDGATFSGTIDEGSSDVETS